MRPPRIAGFSYTGLYRYFLTLCAHRRQPVFRSADVVSTALEQIVHSSARNGFAVVAYCFMPDHLHVLCEALRADSNLTAFVHDAKQRSGHAFGRGTGGRLWQKGFYDRVLRNDEQVLAVVRYIVANPIRAGLATCVGEYPYCGSAIYSLDEIKDCLEVWEPAHRRAIGRRP